MSYTRKEVEEVIEVVSRISERYSGRVWGMLKAFAATFPASCPTCGGDGKCQTCDGSGGPTTTPLCNGCSSICDISRKGHSSWATCQFCNLPHPREMVDSGPGTC